MNIFLSPSETQIEEPFDVVTLSEPDIGKSVEISDRFTWYETLDLNTPPNERVYLSAYIRSSNFKFIYQSEPYSILDFFGDLGGIISIL